MTVPFDAVDRCYDRFMHGCRLYHAEQVVRMLEGADGNGRVLDLAGGTGYYAKALADIGREVVVLDESPRMLARVPVHRRIRILQGDIRQTGLPTASFDVILLSDALHHVQDHTAVLAETARLLKPGGRLLVHDFDRTYFRVTLLGLFERALFGPVHYLSLPELEALCAVHGFQRSAVAHHGWYYLYLGVRP